MDIRIIPHPLNGMIRAVPSKSDAHRLLICAALSHEPTRIMIGNLNDDILTTIECLREMGAVIEQSLIDKNTWQVIPVWQGLNESPLLNCRESGSTLRFLLPVAAVICRNPVFSGTGRLPERPISPLTEQMEAHGCIFTGTKLPLTLQNGITNGTYELRGDVSSQFISGLLFALPLLNGDSEIRMTTPLESAAYTDMTIQALSQFSIQIEKDPTGFQIRGGQKYRSPGPLRTEGDWSSAAFFLTAGAIGKQVSCDGLSLNSCQPDKSILSFLQRFGAKTETAEKTVKIFPALLSGIEIDASYAPDIVPILAIAACAAQGDTVIRKAQRLKLKESDRLTAVADCITRLGGIVRLTDDGMIVSGNGKLKGGEVSGYNDHRIVMSAAIASILCEKNVIIRGTEPVSKSYPGFFSDFTSLGGIYHVI